MSLSQNHTAPFSPVLLMGLAMQPLPLTPLNRVLKSLIGLMYKKHGQIFDRLTDIEKPLYCIDPTDLPFVFVLDANPTCPTLIAYKANPEDLETTATIRGPLATLMALLEGKIDGDALFFTRTLIIEGDTEAVLALRNAVDGSEVNLAHDLSSAFGPLKGPADLVGRTGLKLFERATKDLNHIANALTKPLERRLQNNEASNETMEKAVQKLSKQARRKTKA